MSLQGVADVLSRSGMPIMGAIARPKEAVQTLTEGAGAAGGAALGTMVGGVPGAMVGGAGGARLGRAAGSLMFGEEPTSEELGAAGVGGAAGPAVGPFFRHSARIFGKLPTVKKAVEHAQVATERARRALVGTQAERTITQTADQLDVAIAEKATQIAKARSGRLSGNKTYDELTAAITASDTAAGRAAAEKARKTTLDAAEESLSHLATAVPRGIAKAMTNAEMAVARGAAAVPVPSAQAGTIPGALGALAGGAYGGMEGATSAAALGYLFGQVRGRMAFRLSNNDRFVAWATGLSPRDPLAQAALAFITDVMLQAKDEQELEDARSFYDSMLEYIEEFPEAALGIGAAEGAEPEPEQQQPMRIAPGSIRPTGEPHGSGAPQHVKDRLGTLGTGEPDPAPLMRIEPSSIRPAGS